MMARLNPFLYLMHLKRTQIIRQVKFRTLATVIGVALGTASLTAGFNFSKTAQQELMKEIKGFRTDLVTWRNIPFQPGQDREEGKTTAKPLTSKAARELISAVPEFTACTTVQQSGFRFEAGNRFLPLYGVDAGFIQALALSLSQGRDMAPLEVFRGRPVCVIGHDIAVLMFQHPENALGHVITVLNQEVVIIGVIGKDHPGSLIDAENGVFMPFTGFRNLTSLPDRPGILVCRVKSLEHAEAALEKANRTLNRIHRTDQFSGFLQKEIIEKQTKMIETIDWLIKSISLLTLLVACIGCSNIMIVAANERVREIGLRMALGASKLRIMVLFLTEGILLIFSGGITGIVGGYFLTLELLEPLPRLISGYRHWEFRFYGESIFKSLAVLFVTAVLSSLVPAWRAASKEPSQALRDN